jgi:hypothetical protein
MSTLKRFDDFLNEESVPPHDEETIRDFDNQAEMEENITYTKTQADGDDTVYLNKGREVARWHNNDDYGEITESVIESQEEINEAASGKKYIVEIGFGNLNSGGAGIGKKKYAEGTVEELVSYFSNILSYGKQRYANILDKPKSISAFIKALNRSFDVEGAGFYKRTFVKTVPALPTNVPTDSILDLSGDKPISAHNAKPKEYDRKNNWVTGTKSKEEDW